MSCLRLASSFGFACMLAAQAHSAGFALCPDRDAYPALKGSFCATETMPASNSSVQSDRVGEIRVFIRKFPAPGISKGSVWLVAGGPGESGASFYTMIEALRLSFPDLDLLIPDHRGTGFSSRLCPEQEATGSAGGMALAGAEWGSCFQRLNQRPELATAFSITAAAHDLQYLIAHSDAGKPVYVYGVSYGTQLVLRTLQLGKLAVNGVILDSLVPLQTAHEWDLSQRSRVVDDIGRRVLAKCDRNRQCHRSLGGSAEAAYRRLLVLAQRPDGHVAPVPGKDLKRFFGSVLDVPAARVRIPYLIKDLAMGRSDELDAVLATMKKAGESLGDFPQSPPSIPLVSIISASENNLRPELDIGDLKNEDASLLFSSRLPELLVKPALPLYPRDEYFGRLPGQLPPLLVFSGTLDPKTHYAGALSHVAALKKLGKVGLVSVADAPHFILWTAPECFARYSRQFIQGGAPSDHRCTLTASAP